MRQMERFCGRVQETRARAACFLAGGLRCVATRFASARRAQARRSRPAKCAARAAHLRGRGLAGRSLIVDGMRPASAHAHAMGRRARRQPRARPDRSDAKCRKAEARARGKQRRFARRVFAFSMAAGAKAEPHTVRGCVPFSCLRTGGRPGAAHGFSNRRGARRKTVKRAGPGRRWQAQMREGRGENPAAGPSRFRSRPRCCLDAGGFARASMLNFALRALFARRDLTWTRISGIIIRKPLMGGL